MTDRAHVRGAQIIKMYSGEKGWMVLEDGRRVSPIIIGFRDDNDQVFPVVEEIQDTSTTEDKVKTDTGWQVEPDRVYRLITIRDMTQQELDDRDTARKDGASDLLDTDYRMKALARAMYLMGRGDAPNNAFSNPTNFKNWLRSLM